MKYFPFQFTNKFHTKLRSLFFVPYPARTIQSIQQQFLAGKAELIDTDIYRVWVRDFPARVVSRDGVLITIGWDK